MKKFPLFLLIIIVLLSGSQAVQATLTGPGTEANVYNQYGTYGFFSDSDSGPNSAYVSINLPTKLENGSASAVYNGDVKVLSDSSCIDGLGDTIVSRASQWTDFVISSNNLPDGTYVVGSVNIFLHGSITNVGNYDWGSGAIDLDVSVSSDDNSFAGGSFDGGLVMRPGGITNEPNGFINYGVIEDDIFTGNQYLQFDFDTSIPFGGYVGDSFSVIYTLQAWSGLCYDVNFSNTGNYDISFEGYDAFAQVVPNSAVPVPGTIWLLGSCLVGLAGFKRKFKK